MFESDKHGEISNHTNGKKHYGIWEHAGKARHFSQTDICRARLGTMSAAKSDRNLNGMQMNVKQNLHGIPWTAVQNGAKGCFHGT